MFDILVTLDRCQGRIELSRALALGRKLLEANGPGVGTLVRLGRKGDEIATVCNEEGGKTEGKEINLKQEVAKGVKKKCDGEKEEEVVAACEVVSEEGIEGEEQAGHSFHGGNG